MSVQSVFDTGYEIRTRYSDYESGPGEWTEVYREGGTEPLTDSMTVWRAQSWIVRQCTEDGLMLRPEAACSPDRLLYDVWRCQEERKPFTFGPDDAAVNWVTCGALYVAEAQRLALRFLVSKGHLSYRDEEGIERIAVTLAGQRHLRAACKPTRARLFPASVPQGAR